MVKMWNGYSKMDILFFLLPTVSLPYSHNFLNILHTTVKCLCMVVVNYIIYLFYLIWIFDRTSIINFYNKTNISQTHFLRSVFVVSNVNYKSSQLVILCVWCKFCNLQNCLFLFWCIYIRKLKEKNKICNIVL